MNPVVPVKALLHDSRKSAGGDQVFATKERKGQIGPSIGRGGQARVYEATRGEGQAICALKWISTRFSKRAERFKRELEVHVKLSTEHAANIMPIIDHSITESANQLRGYIVMPKAFRALDHAYPIFVGQIELTLSVFTGIITGIIEAHKAGVLTFKFRCRCV